MQYIALERLESIYKSCNLVSNICVHANPAAKQPMAVIIPHPEHLRHALEGKAGLGVDAHAPLPELCRSRAVAELVLKEANAVGRKNGFKPLELLQTVVLTPDEWTPESGLVTAAQKVQRKKVAEAFAAEIKVRRGWRSVCAVVVERVLIVRCCRRCTGSKIERVLAHFPLEALSRLLLPPLLSALGTSLFARTGFCVSSRFSLLFYTRCTVPFHVVG